MSFFGFDTSLPPDDGGRRRVHNITAPGFAQPQDAFAGLSGHGGNEIEALDFEETYDGLGDQIEETHDTLNDETFGAGPATQENIGKDFDFYGHTDRVADAIREEQLRYQATRPPKPVSQPKKTTKPARTGYEGYIPQLEVSSSIWGLPAKKSPEPTAHQRQPSQGGTKKMMTVEEIEASMLANAQAVKVQPLQSAEPVQQAPFNLQQQLQGFLAAAQPIQHHAYAQPSISPQPPVYNQPPQILQRPHHHATQQEHSNAPRHSTQATHAELPAHNLQNPPHILQRQHPRPQQPQQVIQGIHRPADGGTSAQTEHEPVGPRIQPRQILQNPHRLSGQEAQMMPISRLPQQNQRGPSQGPAHRRGPSYQGPIITSPQQILHLPAEDRAAFLAEDARRAKRNHKIATMAKGNGFMTPQDKNFVSRLQLTQLMSATGSLEDQSPEAKLNDDFYYQVFTQIFGTPRQNPHQPAGQFAQTYLFQTGNRFGGGRRHQRGGDNHVQRMEQQVQRAVEVARSKQKPKDLNFAGSLGKIAFSNSKTPRPLLSVKQPGGITHSPQTAQRPSPTYDPVAERRETLRNVEAVYRSLMNMEDHERRRTPLPRNDPDPEAVQRHMEWRETLQALNSKLWHDLKVMEPVIADSPTAHPFIQILSVAKGKKLIPRVWRHIDDQQRLTMLTLIIVNLDTLDVVAKAVPPHDNPDAPLSAAVKEEVELFASNVMPTLFALINELQMSIVSGLLSLIADRSTIQNLVRTKIGAMLLTMILSHVEVLKESAQVQRPEIEQYNQLFTRLFDLAEPALPYLFAPASTSSASIHDADDFHVWRFLAAMGAASDSSQQQRLVLGVKDRVMETVSVSKALPTELKESRLGNVNLFMTAIGLDVSLL